MLGLGGIDEMFALLIGLVLWGRFFMRQGRVSILSQLMLILLVAVWLVVFKPFQPVFF